MNKEWRESDEIDYLYYCCIIVTRLYHLDTTCILRRTIMGFIDNLLVFIAYVAAFCFVAGLLAWAGDSFDEYLTKRGL